MSVNDIMNYVSKTPGNTNPAVVRSMVEAEMEKSVYASVEELKKGGGVGYIEHKVDVLMPETVIPMYLEYPDDEYSSCLYDTGFAFEHFGGGRGCTVYINNIEHYFTIIKGSLQFYRVDGGETEFEVQYDCHNLRWTGNGSAPETITVSVEEPYDVTHRINESFLPDGYEGLPAKVAFLQTKGVLVNTAEYPNMGGSDEQSTFLFPVSGAFSLVPHGTLLNVHFDGVDYQCKATTAPEMMAGLTVFGNAIYFGGEDTGEPFSGIIAPASVMGTEGIMLIVYDGAETHTIGISLANAGNSDAESKLVVDSPADLDVLFSGNALPVSEDIASALEYAASKQCPLYLRFGSPTSVNLKVIRFEFTEVYAKDLGEGNILTRAYFMGFATFSGMPIIAFLGLDPNNMTITGSYAPFIPTSS